MTEPNQAIACAYCDHRAPADLTDGWECPCGMARITTVRPSLKPFLDFSNLKSEGVGAFVNCTITRHEPFELARLPAGIYKFSLAQVVDEAGDDAPTSSAVFAESDTYNAVSQAVENALGYDASEAIDQWKDGGGAKWLRQATRIITDAVFAALDEKEE